VRVQADVPSGRSQSFQRTPEDHRANEIRASQDLTKLFGSEPFGGALDVGNIGDGDMRS
jgi:hypothetical protein